MRLINLTWCALQHLIIASTQALSLSPFLKLTRMGEMYMKH